MNDEAKETKPEPAHTFWMDYRPGSTSSTGDKIKLVLGVCSKACVFFTESDDLAWETKRTEVIDGQESASGAIRLLTQIRNVLPKKDRELAKQFVASELYHALVSRQENDDRDFFAESSDLVATKIEEHLHRSYIGGADYTALVITAVSIAILLTVRTELVYYLALGAMFGAYGALLSVLQRFRRISFRTFSSRGYLMVQGANRCLLGCLFGVFLVLAQRSGLVLSSIQDNVYAVCVFSVVAGFSERFIPEVMGKLEGKSDIS